MGSPFCNKSCRGSFNVLPKAHDWLFLFFYYINALCKTGSEMSLTFCLLSGSLADDWMFERPSNQYFLGQFLNLDASVRQYNHVPLRIFVDGCVATAVPDVTAAPRYSFIENHGLVRISSLNSHV